MDRYKKYILLVLCLVLMVLLFISWPIFPAHEKDLLVPAAPENIPRGLTTTSRLEPIEFRVKGGKTAIENLAGQKLVYPLDLSTAAIGMMTLPIDRDRLTLPRGVSVIKATPSSVTVRIEKEITKEVPIAIVFSGKPAPGFNVARTGAKPQNAVIRGPASLVDPMAQIRTQPVELTHVSDAFKKEVTLDLNEGLTLVSPKSLILVTIGIQEEEASRKIGDIPMEGRGTAHAFKIEPPLVNIEVKGPATRLDKIEIEKEIRATIDLAGLPPGVHELQAAVAVPVDMTVVEITPAKFRVKIFDK